MSGLAALTRSIHGRGETAAREERMPFDGLAEVRALTPLNSALFGRPRGQPSQL